MKMVALIPARAGSKRIPGKNTRVLAGQPLMYWTMRAAYDSNVFADVQIWTDDAAINEMPWQWPVTICRRDPSVDDEPDIAWVKRWADLKESESFAILRPTSPFRTAATIQRAYTQFRRQEVHSLRAVEPATQHPGKTWYVEGGCLKPFLLNLHVDTKQPWHSSPTQSLPPAFAQNASLEMAWTYVVNSFGTISGKKIAPFYTQGYEGFDLNTEDDWQQAERLIAEGKVELPAVSVARV